MMSAPVLMVLSALLLIGSPSSGQAQAQKPATQQQPPATAAPAQAAKPQQQPPPATPAPKPQAQAPVRAAVPAAARAAVALVVTDLVGKTLPDVRVIVNGPVSREGTTSRDGALTLEGLRGGTYRLRFEAADFITFEREVTVKAGPPMEVDVALDQAPAKPVEPPPTSVPVPSDCRPAAPADPNAKVDILSLPDWFEKNRIGDSEAHKETSVGQTPMMTPNVVQVREPIKDRVRADADELLYVIAGKGVLRTNGREQALDAGALAVIPRGVTYTLERRGRNPLIALSIVGK